MQFSLVLFCPGSCFRSHLTQTDFHTRFYIFNAMSGLHHDLARSCISSSLLWVCAFIMYVIKVHKLLWKSKIFSIFKENCIHNGQGISLCCCQVSNLSPGVAFTMAKVTLDCLQSDQVATCIPMPEGCEHFHVSIFSNQRSFVESIKT